MSKKKDRGGWSNPASADNGKRGGRPISKIEFKRGDMVVFSHALLTELPRERKGFVLSVSRGEIEIQLADDESIVSIYFSE